MSGLLDGLRVLDLSSGLAGPYCARTLADLGAEVIKVEGSVGDPGRLLPPEDGAGCTGATFQELNCGKRGICLDPRSPGAPSALGRLVALSDVLLEDWPPVDLEACGLMPDQLGHLPWLVHCSLTPYGRTGPHSERPGSGLTADAVGGILDQTGFPDGSPLPLGYAFGEMNAGIHAVAAILAARFAQHRTGHGQYIDLSMAECSLGVQDTAVEEYLFSDGRLVRSRAGPGRGSLVPYGVFSAPDGYITMTGWERICAAMDRADLIADPRFSTPLERIAHRAELWAVVEGWLAGLGSVAAAEAHLQGHDVVAFRVRSLAEVLHDPQIEARGLLATVDLPAGGTLSVRNTPFHFSDATVGVNARAPALGEHDAVVLGDLCGLPVGEPAVGRGADSGHPHPLPANRSAFGSADARALPARGAPVAQPLAGVRVIDFTRALAGPYCARMLCDLGAEVIKIEPPPNGDGVRFMAAVRGVYGGYMMYTSRGKRSMGLDVQTPVGREIIEQLVRISDVVVENYRPGVIDRMGLGLAALQRLNPSIVLCSMSGYGATGRYTRLPGQDLGAQALTGVTDLTGEADGPPIAPNFSLTDSHAGIHGAVAVLAALAAREASGRGQRIDAAISDASFWLHDTGVQAALAGTPPRRNGPTHRTLVPRGVFPVGEGWLALDAWRPEQWAALAHVMGHDDLAGEARFATPAARARAREEVERLIVAWLGRFAAPEAAAEVLCGAGVPAEPVRTIPEVVAHPQVVARKALAPSRDPALEGVLVQRTPFGIVDDEGFTSGTYPLHGGACLAILTQLLGYSTARVGELYFENVIQAEERAAAPLLALLAGD